MAPHPESDLGLEEFRALRATIRERGTARLAIATFTFVSWAALALAGRVHPLLARTLVPLFVLAAGFEVVLALHIGVERIGRYLEVYFEPADGGPPAWEHIAGRLAKGGTTAGVAARSLFSAIFVGAAVLNVVVGVLPGPAPWGFPTALTTSLLLHAAFIGRVVQAGRWADARRLADLKRFQSDRAESRRAGLSIQRFGAGNPTRTGVRPTAAAQVGPPLKPLSGTVFA